MKINNLVLACSFLLMSATSAFADSTPRVFFRNLKDGQKVTSPVKVEMGIEGKTLAKAGSISDTEGHHHLIIDGGPIEKGTTVPADATHMHFGQAQSEALLQLAPGKHTLTLQFADGLHRSFGKELSSSVQVEVSPK